MKLLLGGGDHGKLNYGHRLNPWTQNMFNKKSLPFTRETFSSTWWSCSNLVVMINKDNKNTENHKRRFCNGEKTGEEIHILCMNIFLLNCKEIGWLNYILCFFIQMYLTRQNFEITITSLESPVRLFLIYTEFTYPGSCSKEPVVQLITFGNNKKGPSW